MTACSLHYGLLPACLLARRVYAVRRRSVRASEDIGTHARKLGRYQAYQAALLIIHGSSGEGNKDNVQRHLLRPLLVRCGLSTRLVALSNDFIHVILPVTVSGRQTATASSRNTAPDSWYISGNISKAYEGQSPSSDPVVKKNLTYSQHSGNPSRLLPVHNRQQVSVELIHVKQWREIMKMTESGIAALPPETGTD